MSSQSRLGVHNYGIIDETALRDAGYSDRSATLGSTDAALRAGTKLAAIATPNIATITNAKTSGSRADTFEQHRLDPIGGDERQHGTEYDAESTE